MSTPGHGPIYVDQATGRRYTVDASNQPVWLDPPGAIPATTPPPKKRRILPAILIGAGVLLLVGMCSSFLSDKTTTSTAASATPATPSSSKAPGKAVPPAAPSKAAAPATPSKAAPTPTPADEGTLSQRNALRSAESYLQFKGFSRAGLIQQLSNSAGDGFSKADATWAVNHLKGVDWKEQAVRAGESYLKFKGFSRAGLIQQLSSSAGDGFTKAEATYAADKLGL